MTDSATLLARLCWAIDSRRWTLAAANIIAAGSFVAGCVLFLLPGQSTPAIALFLAGSVLWLVSTLGETLLRHGPSG